MLLSFGQSRVSISETFPPATLFFTKLAQFHNDIILPLKNVIPKLKKLENLFYNACYNHLVRGNDSVTAGIIRKPPLMKAPETIITWVILLIFVKEI